jgi:ADP-ribosylglycohydrolase
LLLGALGDAIGSLQEGEAARDWREDRIGPLTDDTQLTVATCSAIIAANRVDPAAIAAEFARWHQQRRFSGLGSSTLKALTELAAGQHWALAGAKGERAAGNGAAMRIAPLAFCLNPFDDDDRRMIRDVCRITHHHDEAYLGALAICQAIHLIELQQTPLHGVIGKVAMSLPDCCVGDRLRELDLLEGKLPVQEVATRFGNTGYVVESVPLAIYAAGMFQSSVEQVLRDVVGCGGDADTNAALAGQLLGAASANLNSVRALLEQVVDLPEYLPVIEQFAAFVSAS